MKKMIALVCAVSLMGTLLPSVFADEMMDSAKIAADDMSYYGPISNFTLENIKKELNGRNGESIIEAEFDMISENSIWDDYEYGSTHYYSKKFQTNIYIPEGLKRFIQKAHIKVSPEVYPVMYDTATAKDTIDRTSPEALMLPVDLEMLSSGSVDYDPNTLRDMTTNEYGASQSVQLELVMTNGSVIPFSQAAYLYIQPDNIEGKKAHLANYYYTLNPNAGYPDMDGMLKTAFAKLREATKTQEAYKASLKKVRAKVDSFTETYTKDIETMVENITTDADFEAIVEKYSKVYARSNLLWDIGYRIDSEMQNDNAQELIDELFTQE